MDLSPTTFRPAEPLPEHAPDWAELLAIAAARAAASPTALAHAQLAREPRPAGAFAPFVAAALKR